MKLANQIWRINQIKNWTVNEITVPPQYNLNYAEQRWLDPPCTNN